MEHETLQRNKKRVTMCRNSYPKFVTVSHHRINTR